MKKSIFLFFAAILCATNAWAWCGNSFITVNGLWCTGSNSYVHTGGKFHGKDLGTLTTLVLGGELQVYPKSSSAASLCYKIDDGNEGTISLPKTGEEGNNSKHSGSGDVDLSALSEGEHTIAVWFKHNSDYDSNDSKNFVASFTIANEAPDRYITGTLAGGWNGNEVKMTYDKDTKKYSHTFTNVAAGEEYKFKVTDGTWTLNWGGAAVSPAIDGVTTDGDGNAKFTLATAGDVTITFDGSKIQLSTTGTLKVPQSYDYYILGTMNAWTVEEEYGFTDEDKDGVYTREITLAAGEHFFKINVGNWDSQWGWSSVTGTYQEATDASDDNKIKITLESEKTFTVLFNSTTKQITFEGLTVPTPTYTVTVSDNTGGFEPLTTGGGEYEEGENATVTASEEVEGWVFVGWMANEEFVANDPTYTFAVEGNTELVAIYAMVMEEEITNLVIDTDWMVLIGGPSTNLQVEVFLGLSEDDGEGGFLLSDESSVSIMGQDATWIDGRASVDMDAKTANAIVVVELGGTYYALSLTMSAPSAEPTNVVVVNAVATYDEGSGALKLTGLWEDAEVFIEIAGYDGKESVEYNTPQGIVFETPDVVAFGNEAEITVAGEDITVVCEGLAPMSGSDVYNVTITTLSKVGTALDNVTTTVAPAKAIVNGQLVIVKDGVKYNAQGAVVK